MRKYVACFLLMFPAFAYANAVWPALYLETRLFSWWAITIGLVIEYLFVRSILNVPPKRAIIATLIANVASAILGIILIPLSGVAWEVFPGLIFYYVFKLGTFNPITWCATFIIACAVNVAIEGYVYKRVFKLAFLFRSKIFLWFMLANSASVGVAIASIVLYPISA